MTEKQKIVDEERQARAERIVDRFFGHFHQDLKRRTTEFIISNYDLLFGRANPSVDEIKRLIRRSMPELDQRAIAKTAKTLYMAPAHEEFNRLSAEREQSAVPPHSLNAEKKTGPKTSTADDVKRLLNGRTAPPTSELRRFLRGLDVDIEEDVLEAMVQRIHSNIVKMSQEYARAKEVGALNPMASSLALEWFSKRLIREEAQEAPSGFIVLIGHGPYEQADLKARMDDHDIELSETEDSDDRFGGGSCKEPPIFVVGRNGWSEEVLGSLFDRHSRNDSVFTDLLRFPSLGHVVRVHYSDAAVSRVSVSEECCPVRVYTQELLLAWLFTGDDPLAKPSRMLDAHAEEHPALKYLLSLGGFRWPSTDAGEQTGEVEIHDLLEDLPQVGLLKHMGYSVGMNGLGSQSRHEILEEVFLSEALPVVTSSDYMREWGERQSAKRLRKMANSIATFCRNAKHRSWSDMDEAIADWEEDLDWLKKRFYDGHLSLQFRWPTTETE
jgi:hypothetical protein